MVNQEDGDHYNAMCASDVGMVYDGQMVSAATVCHLPTMILINMRMHHQYYHDMSNRFWNDMNLMANKAVYPEMIGGEVWEGRIADQMAEWFVKPDSRYEFIRKWEFFIKDALCYQEIDRT